MAKKKPNLLPRDKDGNIKVYNAWWPPDTDRLKIELWAYRTNRTDAQGGFGKEYHFREAFKLMWPDFKMHKWMDMLIHAFCTERFIIVLGHTRASKTYGSAYLFYLDFYADPCNTWTSLTTVTFDGLKSRMWADMMQAIETSRYPNLFKIVNNNNEMKIYLDSMSKKAMIEGFATAKSKDASERIVGKHAPRRRLALDEAEGLPSAIFDAEPNAASAEDFISVKLANPFDRLSIFGQQYEPENGWDSVSPSDLVWRSKKGILVLHFDGLQSYNVELHNRVTDAEYQKRKYRFLLTPEYIETIRQTYGEDSVEWWKFVRGFPPPDGMVSRVFPEKILTMMSQTIEYDLAPIAFGCLDPAFEHDDCVLQIGHYGDQRDKRTAGQFKRSIKIKIKVGRGGDPKDYQIADEVIRICQEENIHPENFIMDKTGNGRGVFAILQMKWSKEIHGVEFGGAPTERPVKISDTDIPKDIFCYFVDELWFRSKAWAEEGLIGGIDNLHEYTKADLGGRAYILQGKKMRLLSKIEMKKITGRSPDYGDAFILLAELLARKGIYVGGSVAQTLPENNNFMYDNEGSQGSWERAKTRSNRIFDIVSDENTFAED